MKIGYQGTLGSFSQIAAKNLFAEEELVNYLTFKDVIDSVMSEDISYGVIPVENSYTGEVGMVLDELFKSNVYICKMYDLSIIQNLIGIKGATISDIKQVYSHEQALMQCSDVLKEMNVEMISFSNTALASEYIKEQNDKSKASIASKLTAELYGLEILKEAINNNQTNTTRFAVISKKIVDIKERFAFMFTVKDGSGALAKVLNVISNQHVNLTAITSRSTHNLAWKYYFYCEAEGSLYSENIQKMIEILKNKCETFKIIGSY